MNYVSPMKYFQSRKRTLFLFESSVTLRVKYPGLNFSSVMRFKGSEEMDGKSSPV